jgi:hypothetical protein
VAVVIAGQPILPPYPSQFYVDVRVRRVLVGTWALALALLCLRVDFGWLLFVPGLVQFARGFWRSPRWRDRALDGVEQQCSRLTAEERDERIATIFRVYGGQPFPKVKRRVEEIRRLPTKDRVSP